MKPIVLLYNYQTLIAGALAFGGAVLTVVFLRRQIFQSDAQELERRRRENLAARAMMPAALSEIGEYSRECVKLLRPLLPALPEQVIRGEIQEIPLLPAEALFTLRQSVEFGSNDIAENIADLIRKLQIQRSRLHTHECACRCPMKPCSEATSCSTSSMPSR